MAVYTSTRRLLLPAILVLVTLQSVRSFGQQAASPAPSQTVAAAPTLDFLVVGRDGTPIRDLKADELTLKVDGHPRTVRSLHFAPTGDAVPAGTATAVPPAAPFSTNTGSSDGRLVLLVIDDDSIHAGDEAKVRDAVTQFIDRLGPHDLVGLAGVHGTLHVNPTTDHAAARQAAAQFSGTAPPTAGTGDAVCRAKAALQTFASALQPFAGSDVPTVAVLISPSLVVPGYTAMGGGGGRGGRSSGGSSSTCDLSAADVSAVATGVAAAHGHAYAVLSPGGVNGVGTSDSAAGLERLASAAGTQLLQFGSTGDNPLDRVARETSGEYLATLDPDPADLPGSTHRIELHVNRDGAAARVNSDWTIAKSEAPAALTPRDLLQTQKTYRDLPLGLTTYVARNAADPNLRIVAAFAPLDATALTAASAGLFDASGRAIQVWTARADDLGRTPVLAALTAAPGTYRLRVSATDANGKVGAVDTTVVAQLTDAGKFKLSSVIVGSSSSGAFSPKLQFSSEPSAQVYLDVYGGQKGASVAAFLELALTTDGEPFLNAPLALTATSEPDHFTAIGTIPMGGLPAGDYVVRVVVAEGQTPVIQGRAVRTVRKVGR